MAPIAGMPPSVGSVIRIVKVIKYNLYIKLYINLRLYKLNVRRYFNLCQKLFLKQKYQIKRKVLFASFALTVRTILLGSI